MARNNYEQFVISWEGREIEVSYQADWLNSGQWHLELRSADALPVTSTGYRSAFVSEELIKGASEIEGYVLRWLDRAAADPVWHQTVAASRQLKLF